MPNTEEKVRAFLSDEKKAEAIASDDTFMEKLASGAATPQDIATKFDSVGLPLTEEESKLVDVTTTRILTKTPIAQLGEKSLDAVSGGSDWMKVASTAGFAAGAAGAAGLLGCSIARMVCNYKAKNAALAGNIELSHDYTDHATALGKVSKACAGVGAAGVGAGFAFTLFDHSGDKKISPPVHKDAPSKTSSEPVWTYNPMYEGK